MAEIPVQVKKKRTAAWLWIVIVALIVIAAAVFFINRNKARVTEPDSNTTSYWQPSLDASASAVVVVG